MVHASDYQRCIEQTVYRSAQNACSFKQPDDCICNECTAPKRNRADDCISKNTDNNKCNRRNHKQFEHVVYTFVQEQLNFCKHPRRHKYRQDLSLVVQLLDFQSEHIPRRNIRKFSGFTVEESVLTCKIRMT